jgi:hypothetical protein
LKGREGRRRRNVDIKTDRNEEGEKQGKKKLRLQSSVMLHRIETQVSIYRFALLTSQKSVIFTAKGTSVLIRKELVYTKEQLSLSKGIEYLTVSIIFVVQNYIGCSIQTSHILSDLSTESMNGRKMKLQEIQEQLKTFYLTH